MKGLLIKDFKLLKGQKNFFMTITAISIIMIIVSPGTSFPIGFLGFVGALFSLSSISYDEFDNGNAFLFSLPITRKDYVLEKYIFGLISGIMFLLLGTVISLVVIGITKTGSFNEIFLTAGSLFPTILLILSIMLPFILKFGGEKGRIAIIGVMGFIFVIGLLLIKTTEYLEIDYTAKGVVFLCTDKHKEVINSYAENGYRYVGFIPTEIDAKGCMRKIDLIFEKED